MSLNLERLEQSFALVKDQGPEFSTTFYGTLFADYPEVEPLFRHALMEEQGKKLFASLVLVVDNLRNPDVLSNALKGLGTKHVKYGVLPQHYPMVGGSLLKTFGVILDDQWTDDTQQAWVEAYQAVSQIMLEGADYSPKDLDLPEQ